jgi:hypothetical protein
MRSGKFIDRIKKGFTPLKIIGYLSIVFWTLAFWQVISN